MKHISIALCLIFLSASLWAESASTHPNSDISEVSQRVRVGEFLKYMAIGEKASFQQTQNSFYVLGGAFAASTLLTANPDKTVPIGVGLFYTGIGLAWGLWPQPAATHYQAYLENRHHVQDVREFVKDAKKTYAGYRYLSAGLYAAFALLDHTLVSEDPDKVYVYPNDVDRMYKAAFLSLALYTLLTESAAEQVCQAVIDDSSLPTHPQQTWHVGPYQNTLAVMTEISF